MSDFFIIEITVLEGGVKIISPLQPEVIGKIEERLGLRYAEDRKEDANLCYADIPGLRPEFRKAFTMDDLKHYIMPLPGSNEHGRQGTFRLQIPYPADAESFWKVVRKSERQ